MLFTALVSIPKPEILLKTLKVEFSKATIPIPAGPIKTAINLVRIREIKIKKNCTPPKTEVVFKIS